MSRDDRFANGRTLSVLLDGTLFSPSSITTAILFA